jgi:small subunit ribosomal protein S9
MEHKKEPKKYFYAKGRRKNAIATVRLYEGKGENTIDGKEIKKIYGSKTELKRLYLPFEVTDTVNKFYFSAHAIGGGKSGQLDALKLAISRSLLKVDKNFRKPLKKEKLLTRDPRMVERKKPGFKKARKKEQYSKR